MKNHFLPLLFLLSVLTAAGCAGNKEPAASLGDGSDSGLHSDSTSQPAAAEEPDAGEAFLLNFPQNFSDYELLEYVVGDETNSPIVLAAVGEDKRDGTSASLFVVDTDGIGHLKLAADLKSYYYPQDGLHLEGNQVVFSLECITDEGVEIHEFRITVKHLDDGTGHRKIYYGSDEKIRK